PRIRQNGELGGRICRRLAFMGLQGLRTIPLKCLSLLGDASMTTRPRLLLTMGDVAGIGPEIIAKAWPDLLPLCRPVVVGDPGWLGRALDLVKQPARVQAV